MKALKLPRQPCTECGAQSIPGLAKGAGKCRYHWTVGIWGKEWADQLVAQKVLRPPKENK